MHDGAIVRAPAARLKSRKLAPGAPARLARSITGMGDAMEYVTLGRTGLRVSVAGLGCGGFSRVGLGTGKTEAESVALIRAALDLGVNLLDTASAYGTEGVVGQAIKAVPRDSVVVCTKTSTAQGEIRFAPDAVVKSLDNSLRILGTDYIDVFQLHAVRPEAYQHARDVIVPVLLKEKEKGKFRHLGLTETAPNDPEQKMLQQAVQDDVWETAMLAFHMMHQNARANVFPGTQAKQIGTLLMFAVRSIFARPDQLNATMRELVASGQVQQRLINAHDPLGFLVHPGGASSVVDAAYRFVRHEPGVDVVLFGTGDQGHLRSNVESILKPPLPEADRDKLTALFGRLLGVGLDRPPTRH
jgi:aryl-alcohol dehydrogenase-like predicted oxidoreductase